MDGIWKHAWRPSTGRRILTCTGGFLSLTAILLSTTLVNNGSIALADDADCKNSDFYYETVSMNVEGEAAGKTCYTASDLRTVSDDLSKNGASSKYYNKFHESMLANPETTTDGSKNYKGTRGYMKMGNQRSDITGVNSTGSNTDGDTMQFRLIGINHDDKADGSGKTGLTFQAVQIYKYPSDTGNWYYYNSNMMNKKTVNNGGWRDSNYRRAMNTGNIWNSLPEDFRDNVTPVEKQTNNKGCLNANYSSNFCKETSSNRNTRGNSSTIDKFWLASPVELYGNVKNYSAYYDPNSGSQYEYWHQQGMTTSNYGKLKMSSSGSCIDGSLSCSMSSYDGSWWWLRSPDSYYSSRFASVGYYGYLGNYYASLNYGLVPCFSF